MTGDGAWKPGSAPCVRGWGHVLGLAVLVAGLAGMLVDAAARREAQVARGLYVHSMVRVAGWADLALSSSSRWLRHPSLSEPGAAFADGPALLDNDPAGACLGPPYECSRALEAGRPMIQPRSHSPPEP